MWLGVALLCRMYATAAARGDGLLLLCGGRDVTGVPLGDAYGFARHRDGRWEWHAAPGAMPTGRYQHGAIFVGNRLHISGGAVGGGRMVSARRAQPALPAASVSGEGVGVWRAGGPLRRRARSPLQAWACVCLGAWCRAAGRSAEGRTSQPRRCVPCVRDAWCA